MTVLRKEDPSLFGFKTSVLALGIIDAQSALLCGKDTLLLPNDELILTGDPSEIRAAGFQDRWTDGAYGGCQAGRIVGAGGGGVSLTVLKEETAGMRGYIFELDKHEEVAMGSFGALCLTL